MNNKISMAVRLQFTKFGLITKAVPDVIEIIRSGEMLIDEPGIGSYSLRDITEAIRNETDSGKQNFIKERFLPVVFFNGIWDGAKICEYSCITALDFDHIETDAQLTQVLAKLKSTPFVMAVFRTFKPRRIKAIILHDNADPDKHGEMYGELIELFRDCGIDTFCKDLSRKTFIPWDEDIWVNPDCQPYHFVSYTKSPQAISSPGIITPRLKKRGKSKSPQSIVSILNSSWRKKHPEYWQFGNRANSIFKCACQFCEYGVPQDMAKEYFMNGGWIADDFTEEEVTKNVNGAYNYNRKSYGSKDFI